MSERIRRVREAATWERQPILTDEEIHQSAATRCVDHTEGPSGYGAAEEWAEEMSKTHKQLICGECLLWKIWVPK